MRISWFLRSVTHWFCFYGWVVSQVMIVNCAQRHIPHTEDIIIPIALLIVDTFQYLRLDLFIFLDIIVRVVEDVLTLLDRRPFYNR